MRPISVWLGRNYPLFAVLLLALPPRLLGWNRQIVGDDEAAHILAALRLAVTQPLALDPLQNTFAQLLQAYHGWAAQGIPFLVYAGLRGAGLPIGESTVHLPALLLNLGALAVWYLWAQRIWGRTAAFWGILILAWLAGTVRLGRSLHGNENFQMLGQGVACLVLERHIGTGPLATRRGRWGLGWPLLLYIGMDNVFFLFGLAYVAWIALYFAKGSLFTRIRRVAADFVWRNPAAWACAALVGLYAAAAAGTVFLQGQVSTHGFLLRTFFNRGIHLGFHLGDLIGQGIALWGPAFLVAGAITLCAATVHWRDRGVAMLSISFGVYLIPMLLGGHSGRLVILSPLAALLFIRMLHLLARRISRRAWAVAPVIALAGLAHSLGTIQGLGPAAPLRQEYSTVALPNGLKAVGYLLRHKFDLHKTAQTLRPAGLEAGGLRLAMNMDAAGQFYAGARYAGAAELSRFEPEIVVTFEAAGPGRYRVPEQDAMRAFVARHNYGCAYAVVDGTDELAQIWVRGTGRSQACELTLEYAPLAEAFDRTYFRISDFASLALGGY